MRARMLCVLLVLLTAGAAYAQDRGLLSLMANEQRVALVVGNSAYQNGPLSNPVNDADDMAAALQNLGFRVTKLKNASNRQMVEAINRFGQDLRKGGVGLFFFAGHGVQSKGRNFLIPVGAKIRGEEQLEFESVDANRVLAAMDAARNRVNIIILDACRNNPYARSFRSASRGLAQMEAAKGSLIAFATGPGSVAADGKGRNGLYTQHLLQSLQHSQSDIDKVFRRVTAGVTRATGNRQVPWKADSLTGEFYFRPDSGGGGASVVLATPSAPQTDLRANDVAVWETVKESNSAAELQAYLEQFPDGIFAGVARARLKTLASTRPPVQVATAAPTTGPSAPSTAATLSGDLQSKTPDAVFRDCDVCPEMVVIPAGSFTMGSPTSGQGRDDDEGPQHSVNIPRALAAGKFEVTFDEWDACVRERGCAHNPGDAGWGHSTRPVINVSWSDAKQYTQWLATKTGRTYRLLSEAEWEYVARAGTTTPFNTGSNINPTQANYNSLKTFAGSVTGVSRKQTVAVGSYQPNAFGLYDVHGNVWEWTEDCWNANHSGAPGDGSARKSGDCGQRVLRGGSWLNNPQNLRSAGRSRGTTGTRVYSFGFRVARTL